MAVMRRHPTIRPVQAGYAALCVPCIDRRWTSIGLNELDWFETVKLCKVCLGTNKSPIPLAEVVAKREINNGR